MWLCTCCCWVNRTLRVLHCCAFIRVWRVLNGKFLHCKHATNLLIHVSSPSLPLCPLPVLSHTASAILYLPSMPYLFPINSFTLPSHPLYILPLPNLCSLAVLFLTYMYVPPLPPHLYHQYTCSYPYFINTLTPTSSLLPPSLMGTRCSEQGPHPTAHRFRGFTASGSCFSHSTSVSLQGLSHVSVLVRPRKSAIQLFL